MKTFKKFLKEQEGKTLYFTFGRFDPPTLGHRHLFSVLKEKAGSNDWLIFPSRTTDLKKSFLPIEDKIRFMKEINPDYAEHIVNNESIRTIIDILKNYNYNKYVLVVGKQDAEEWKRFIPYAPEGTTLEIPEYTELERDNSSDISGMRSSKLKEYLVNEDEESFINGIGNRKVGKEIYDMLLPYKDKIEKYVIKKNKI